MESPAKDYKNGDSKSDVQEHYDHTADSVRPTFPLCFLNGRSVWIGRRERMVARTHAQGRDSRKVERELANKSLKMPE